MKLGLINSAFQQVGIDTATGLKHVSRIGFDCVDIFTEAIGISKKEVALVRRTAEKLALPIIVDWVEEAYRETARLMDLVRLRS